MDLSVYYKVKERKEALARQNCEWLIQQLTPEEDEAKCKIGWSDCSKERAVDIGHIIGAMMFSSGYWAYFTTRQKGDGQTLYFTIRRMSPQLYQRQRRENGVEDKIDDDENPTTH